ncbi:MAG TPA: DUF2268 domain-containing putative Zn-dependent protease [Chitinophagaceae bacterium]|nr:DUF2268 domain-containing putative Zn-dependent protease [Chitinophagaceae bacterium]
MKKWILQRMLFLLLSVKCLAQTNETNFSKNPTDAKFHTEDIINFWKVFDETNPNFSASAFQEKYIDIGSKGLKGFVKNRIENGNNLSKTLKANVNYYAAIRESSLSIDNKKERFYECFNNLKKIYPEAVFPDVYFVIGAKNSGGTSFSDGLIIGAEMFGEEKNDFKPVLDIGYVDEVVAHELVHFQQKYATNNSLLAQCIREGSADFICELISGSHSNTKIYEYGNAHTKELWNEFITQMNGSDWGNWLYSSKDKSRPKGLGYWVGYKITKAYYDKAKDKTKAIQEILNIKDFNSFLSNSGYNGE